MKKHTLYRIEYLNNHWYKDTANISADSFIEAAKTAEKLKLQEKWREIESIKEIDKIYL